MLLSGVGCSGVEKELLDCRYTPAMPIECTHSRDVAVTCVGMQVCIKVTVGLFWYHQVMQRLKLLYH